MEAPEQTEVFQAKYIPKQTPTKAEHLFDGMTMKAMITSNPPLGQVTLLSEGTPLFTVLLETDESRTSDLWEVSIWYSPKGEDWVELPLKATDSNVVSIVQCLKKQNSPTRQLYFSGALDIKTRTNFTIKFRAGPDQPWKWAKDQQGTSDGTLVLKIPAAAISNIENLNELIGDLNPVLEVTKVRSQTPNTSVWSVVAPVEAAKGDNSAFVKIKLGKPWHGDFLQWFALVRIWTPWLCPRQGKSHFELDKDAIMCSFLDSQGRHLVLMAISGVEDILAIFESDEAGNVVLSVRNDDEKPNKATVIVALGDDFESANAAAMYQARSVVTSYEKTTGEEAKEIQAYKDGVQAQWMENWFDGLTYCTWNGLGQKLTEAKVLEAVDRLSKANINITNLIIDDNWQNLDYRGHGQFQHGWSSFEADPKTFPNGLKSAITQIRSKHPNIQHIAVWHALWGYWGGIDPTGEIAKKYKTIETVRVDGERRNLPLGGKLTLVAKEDVPKFYDDFYSFLSSCGVDAVKTDAQFMFDTLEYAKARADLFNTYLDSWTISSLKHFSVKAISCMSQTPQILFHSQLPTSKPAILVRNSDDFFPEIPSSHPWHVWTNAHNSLFTQHLNIIPDWDMFQTVHDYSGFHAAARCVSGGPIYITDVPGHHDIDLINQMTGQTPRGKTVIFRPDVVGKSLDQYVGYNDEVLLKVGTYHGRAYTGTGIIGIFNTSPRPLTELIPLSRIPGVAEAQYYIVRAHSSGLYTSPIQVTDKNAILSVSLDIRGYEILSAYPLRGFVTKSPDTLWIAALGLLGKMASAASVVSTSMTMGDTGKVEIECAVKALGVMGFYISALAGLSVEENMIATLVGQVIPFSCVKVKDQVLEIDAERAWKELNIDGGWTNEVKVKLFINPS